MPNDLTTSPAPVDIGAAPPPRHAPVGGRISGITARPRYTRRQKAAIVVRLLLAEGAHLPLSKLPELLQAELTAQMAEMRYVDRATLKTVIEEFATELDSIGLAFPPGLEGALSVLEGALSPDMAARLREQAGMVWCDDPWEAVAEFEAGELRNLLERQSPEVGAVLLSKLKVAKAADLLGRLPGARARRLTFAMNETAGVDPATVNRIGLSLAAELKATPPRAFPDGAVERVGAILNVSTSDTRDDLLAGLDETDRAFADEVRRAIFTFPDIPARLRPLDVPAALRGVPQDQLVLILANIDERSKPVVDFLLANMSKRLAGSLRDEAEEAPKARARDIDAAQSAVIAAIRALADAGEIQLQIEEDEDN